MQGDISLDMKYICKFLPQLSLCLSFQLPIKQVYATIIISILRLMEAQHYEILFDSSIDELIISSQSTTNNPSSTSTIESLLNTSIQIISNTTYPSNWFDLLILRNR